MCIPITLVFVSSFSKSEEQILQHNLLPLVDHFTVTSQWLRAIRIIHRPLFHSIHTSLQFSWVHLTSPHSTIHEYKERCLGSDYSVKECLVELLGVPRVRKPQRLIFPQKRKFRRLKYTSLFSKSVVQHQVAILKPPTDIFQHQVAFFNRKWASVASVLVGTNQRLL